MTMRFQKSLAAIMATLLAACSSSPLRTAASATPVAALPSAADVAVREQTADQQIRQAIARLTFGARPGDYERVRAIGVDRWIARQLDPSRIDDRATDAWLVRFRTLTMKPTDLARDYPPPQTVLAQDRRREASSAARVDSNTRPASRLDAADSAALRDARRRAQ